MKCVTVLVVISVVLNVVVTEDDSEWTWSDNKRRSDEDKPSARYEVFERPGGYPGDFDRPIHGGANFDRPLQGGGNFDRPIQGGGNFDRPIHGGGNFDRPLHGGGNFDRPTHGGGHFRPGNFRPQAGGVYGNRPGGFRPEGGYGSGVLTGPVPSWVQEAPFKHYDRCKCAETFNCNSPGIAYGHCDAGKQYCCYNSKGEGGPLPSRPNHSLDNGVLVGPGGPVDGHRPGGFYPHKPAYDGPQNGVLVGPGGPFDRPGRPGLYPRSSKKD